MCVCVFSLAALVPSGSLGGSCSSALLLLLLFTFSPSSFSWTRRQSTFKSTKHILQHKRDHIHMHKCSPAHNHTHVHQWQRLYTPCCRIRYTCTAKNQCSLVKQLSSCAALGCRFVLLLNWEQQDMHYINLSRLFKTPPSPTFIQVGFIEGLQ